MSNLSQGKFNKITRTNGVNAGLTQDSIFIVEIQRDLRLANWFIFPISTLFNAVQNFSFCDHPQQLQTH